MKGVDSITFIKRSKDIHGNKYDYSNTIYTISTDRVKIRCRIHGEFEILPQNHYKGQGCRECYKQSLSAKVRKPSNLVINNFKAKHGDKYDYSEVEYINNRTKVKIICPIHGDFWQAPYKHEKGQGCPLCGNIKIGERLKNNSLNNRPDLFHVETPKGSKAVPVGSKGKYALVDEDDYERVIQYNWTLIKLGYIYNNSLGYLHRFITNCPDDKVVDHINHNTLDNRKINLRVCEQKQNCKNSRPNRYALSKYKGVHYNNRCKKWKAALSVDKKEIYLGLFSNEEDAAKAYDEAARKHHKEFAYLNFR